MIDGFPRISIVTATLNRRVLLERAIRSAAAQVPAAFEHIIIDGRSTDGTIEMLRAYPHLRIVSEADSNLYDAWNKGLRLATGDIVCILNSDDEVPEGAFAEVARMAAREPDADLYSGAVELVRAGGGNGEAAVRRVIDDARMIALREQDIGSGVPLTNGRYLSLALLRRIGLFDERYPALSDRQFFLRALLAGARNVTTQAVLYRYHVHGQSLTLNDSVPSTGLAREALRAAEDGLREAAGDRRAQDAYARWAAWSSLYLAGLMARRGHRGEAWDVVKSAFRRDRAWLARLAPIILRHLRERAARRGRLVP